MIQKMKLTKKFKKNLIILKKLQVIKLIKKMFYQKQKSKLNLFTMMKFLK